MITDEYVNNIQERLSLYTELDQIENNEGVAAFKNRLVDRFGPLPIEVDQLFNGLRLRWICKSMGFERLVLKNQTMRCFFVANAQSQYYESKFFNNLLAFVSTKGPSIGLNLKQTDKYLILIKKDIKDLKVARVFLEHMKEDI
jgi:transcription-repair coupling factor (superfamily II helicase)